MSNLLLLPPAGNPGAAAPTRMTPADTLAALRGRVANLRDDLAAGLPRSLELDEAERSYAEALGDAVADLAAENRLLKRRVDVLARQGGGPPAGQVSEVDALRAQVEQLAVLERWWRKLLRVLTPLDLEDCLPHGVSMPPPHPDDEWQLSDAEAQYNAEEDAAEARYRAEQAAKGVTR